MNINNFGPFNSEIWGSVSDILTLIVTTIGSILVLATLREQRRINNQQIEINRLSMEKDRRDIRPFFKIKNPRYYPNDLIFVCEIYLTHAIASTVQFIDKTPDDITINASVISKIGWDINETNTIHIKKSKIDGPLLMMEIRFHDEAGRVYSQFLRLVHNQFSLSLPLLVPIEELYPRRNGLG